VKQKPANRGAAKDKRIVVFPPETGERYRSGG